jgi:hypothetical protein
MHDLMEEVYDDWVAQAPPHFFPNDFFRESTPLIITCLYGQDQPICGPTTFDLEKRMWSEERDYKAIKYFSFALASHTRSVP